MSSGRICSGGRNEIAAGERKRPKRWFYGDREEGDCEKAVKADCEKGKGYPENKYFLIYFYEKQ